MSFGPHLFLALLEGTVTAFVLALIALGLSLVFGVMRIVNIAHGEFFMLGAVLAWSCSMLVGGGPLMGFAVALVVGPLIVGAMAVVADGLILRRINYQPESTIVATIGALHAEPRGKLWRAPWARWVQDAVCAALQGHRRCHSCRDQARFRSGNRWAHDALTHRAVSVGGNGRLFRQSQMLDRRSLTIGPTAPKSI